MHPFGKRLSGHEQDRRRGPESRITLLCRETAYGISKDLVILDEMLGRHNARFVSMRSGGMLRFFRRPKLEGLILHLERLQPRGLTADHVNWVLPNQERFPRRHLHLLQNVDLVLAKSRHAEEIFSALKVPTFHLGFTSEDRLDTKAGKAWNRFLHLAGGSTLKGTEDILSLWTRHPEWPELVLVQKSENAPKAAPPNVKVLNAFIPSEQLKNLQNSCGIHLCPSRAEGWGHYIVEGLSVGSVVVTTDAPPMNELVTSECGVLVPVHRSEPRHLGTNFYVDTGKLESAVQQLIEMSDAEKAAIGGNARKRFERIDAEFRARAVIMKRMALSP
jgi:hypothetical protein